MKIFFIMDLTPEQQERYDYAIDVLTRKRDEMKEEYENLRKQNEAEETLMREALEKAIEELRDAW